MKTKKAIRREKIVRGIELLIGILAILVCIAGVCGACSLAFRAMGVS